MIGRDVLAEIEQRWTAEMERRFQEQTERIIAAVASKSDEDRELMDTEAAARWLGVKPQTLALWRTKGVLGPDHLKIERRVMYRFTDLKRYVEQQVVRH